MRSRAEALSFGRGLVAKSEGVKLVCLLVEPFDRPRRRVVGSASLRRTLARSRSLISSSSAATISLVSSCRPSASPSYPVTNVESAESEPLAGLRSEIEGWLLMSVRVLLAPQFKQQRRHHGSSHAGPMHLGMAPRASSACLARKLRRHGSSSRPAPGPPPASLRSTPHPAGEACSRPRTGPAPGRGRVRRGNGGTFEPSVAGSSSVDSLRSRIWRNAAGLKQKPRLSAGRRYTIPIYRVTS